MQHSSVEKEFVDEERIKSVYYRECEELLKERTGAKKVFIFEHTIRSVLRSAISHTNSAKRPRIRRKYNGKQGIHTNAPLHRKEPIIVKLDVR